MIRLFFGVTLLHSLWNQEVCGLKEKNERFCLRSILHTGICIRYFIITLLGCLLVKNVEDAGAFIRI